MSEESKEIDPVVDHACTVPCGQVDCCDGLPSIGDLHVAQNVENPVPTKLNPGEAYQILNSIEALLGQTPEGDVMIAVRCPCGFFMGISAPTKLWNEGSPQNTAIEIGTRFISTLADHLELLSERIVRIATYKAGPNRDIPTETEIIESYHNNPCPLRGIPVVGADATVKDAEPIVEPEVAVERIEIVAPVIETPVLPVNPDAEIT